MQKLAFLIFISFALSAAAADYEHGTNIHDTTLYVLPGSSSEKLARQDRGRDLVVLERANMDNNPWIKVLATIVDREREKVRELTGWVAAKNVVTVSTPN